MERKLIEQLREIDDRPVQSYRMVGNRRIEVWFLGEHESIMIELKSEPEKPKRPAIKWMGVVMAIDEMTVKELKEVARMRGLQVSGLRKAELIQAIEDHILEGGE